MTQKRRPRIPKRITVAWLERRYACGSAVKIFKTLFGRSAEFTRSNVNRFEDEFGPDATEWLADTLFGTDAEADMYSKASHCANPNRTYLRLFWNQVAKQRGEKP